jgi:hypothetical protein
VSSHTRALPQLLKLQPPEESAAAREAVAQRITLWLLLWNLDRARALRTCDEIVRSRPVPERLLQSIYGHRWLRDHQERRAA